MTTPSPSEYYLTNPFRRSLLGHLSFGVRSYTRSKAFYIAILATFGVSLVFDDPLRKIAGFGLNPNQEVINIFERGEDARASGPGSHVAFNAPSRDAVKAFWESGMKAGGKDEGEPGVREHYGPKYYAAFLLDPDGFKLEAVFQE